MKKSALIISGVFWDDTWQRHHNITQVLLENGYEVDFVSGVKSSGITISKLTSVFLSKFQQNKKNSNSSNPRPESGFKEHSAFNLPYQSIKNIALPKILTSLSKKEFDVVICYIPCPLSLSLLTEIKYKKLIYDCVRNFSGWSGIAKSVIDSEIELASKADQVWVDSYYLKNKMHNLNQNIVQILPSVSEDYGFKSKQTNELKSFAFFGSVSDHFDTKVVDTFASMGVKLYLWGVDELGIADKYSNVEFMGYCSNEKELIEQLRKYADAIIIPYKGVMEGVIPAKLLQSLTSRMPVFVSSFYDADQLKDILYVYKNSQELEQQIKNYDAVEFGSRLLKINDLIASNTHNKLAENIMSNL